MQTQKSSVWTIQTFTKRCRTQFSNKAQQLNNKLYQDIINADQDDQVEINSQKMALNCVHQFEFFPETQTQSLSQNQTQSINQPSSLIEKQNYEPQTIPINTIIKPRIKSTSKQQKPQQNQNQPIIHTKKSIRFKLNPRMNKFIRQQRNLIKQKEKQLLQKIIQQKSLQQKAKQLEELKQKQIKKLQLKEKLRKLNLQLDQQKKHLRSHQKDLSFFNEQNQGLSHSRSYMNPEDSHILKNKVSTNFIRDNLFPQKSGIRSKSDTEFRLRKLKQQEEMYTPLKHEAAFKLIEKMHAEKLRKHEKIVNEMRRKQEREIEGLKKLQEEKQRQKNIKRVRQVLYYTPKPTRMKIVEEARYSELSKQPLSHMNAKMEDIVSELIPSSKGNFNGARQDLGQLQKNDEIDSQTGLVIKQESRGRDFKNKKHETLFTEQYGQEEFQPTTEEGKQFAEALRQLKSKQELQGQGTKLEHPQDLNQQQLILDNQFI